MKFLTLALTGLILLGAAQAAVAAGPVDVEANAGIYGKYVWRGITVTDDPVLQADVTAGVAGLSLGVWGNVDLTDVNADSPSLNEVDWTLAYGVSLPKISLSLGFIHYRFPDFSDANTTEAFVGAELNVPLSPALTIYQDVDAVEGGYWAASVSHGVPLSPATNLELSAGVGLGSKSYVQGYFGIDPTDPVAIAADLTGDTSLTDAHIGAAVPFNLVPMVTVTPGVTYSTLMGDAKDAMDAAGGNTDAFVWSISAGFGF